jgi:Retrotransposon gag protein
MSSYQPAQITAEVLNDPNQLGALLHNLQQVVVQQQATINQQTHELANTQLALQAAQHVPIPQIHIPANAFQTGGGLKVQKPEVYKGERGAAARTFLQSIRIYSELRPNDFPDDATKIRWVLSFLHDKAAEWAQPLVRDLSIDPTAPRVTDWNTFETEFKTTFFDPDEQRTASFRLQHLRQTRSASEYASEFRGLVALLGWTEQGPLMHAFYDGLKEGVKDALRDKDDPSTLDEMITLAIRIDNRRFQRDQERKAAQSPSSTSSARPAVRHATTLAAATATHKAAPTPTNFAVPRTPHVDAEAMDLSAGRGRLSPEERQRRVNLNLCLYCGQAGHRKSDHFRNAIAATEFAPADTPDANVEQQKN